MKSLRLLRKKVWFHCKRLTREKYKRPDGKWECYTCGRIITELKDCHTGHFIPSSVGGVFLRYDLRNLRPQCYHCNINLGGNGAQFYANLVAKEGQEYVDQLFRDKSKIVKESEFLPTLLQKYEKL